jgi:hypothetical protein
MEINLSKPYKGLHTDNSPVDQPKESYRFALNAVNTTTKGNNTCISNEMGNTPCTSIPFGYYIIGDRYIEDNQTVLFLVNKFGRQEIGLLKKDSTYETIVNTKFLGFRLSNQIDCTYRLRRGNEKIIYWVDGHNKPRTFNLSRPQDFYTVDYQNYLKSGGNPNTYTLDKWDSNSFNLIKSYTKIPYFSKDVEILNYGSIKSGSYNFAIQYVDEDLNPTEWINVSNTVNIYNDNTTNSYESIRGSYDLHEFQKFPVASKTIKLTLLNLDESFPYYRIAVIQANAGTGKVNKVILSEKQSSNNPIFNYSGNDEAFSEISIEEIKIEKETIYKPQHIEQLENRLILANTEGSNYNWCDFQKYASKINSNLKLKPVILNDIQSEANVKNAKSTFFYRGYMPGEVYSFGVMYIMKDMSLSPVYHVPGKAVGSTSNMSVYETNYIYPDIHNCITNDYWGKDFMGNPILGSKVRHHKFPLRSVINEPLVSSTTSTVNFYRHRLQMKITLKDPVNKPYPLDTNGNPILINYSTNYQVTGDPITNQTGVFYKGSLGAWIDVQDVVNDVNSYFVQLYPPNYLNIDSTSDFWVNYMQSGNEYFNVEYNYLPTIEDTINNVSTSKIYGIEFSNIDKPHPDVIGFYIMRNEAFDEDKIIIDNVIVGPNVKENNYSAFTHIRPNFPTSKFDKKSVWFFSPEVNYTQNLNQFNKLKIEGKYTPSVINTPTVFSQATDKDGDSLGEDQIAGVYIEDVQVGSSYDKAVHKKREKDTDGFSLQCGYRNTLFSYSNNNTQLPELESNFMLAASHNKLINTNNYFNVSTDNRISMTEFKTDNDTNIFVGTPLYYATLQKGFYNNGTFYDMNFAYQDFMTRAYYKEHMKPVYFDTIPPITSSSITIYNGDAQISGFNFINTVFRQLKIEKRKNKSNVWKYILAGVMIVAAIAIAIASVGTATAVSVGLVGAALSIAGGAVMLTNSGIQSDKLIAMFDEHYSKGLLKCVEDADIIAQEEINVGDDCLQWFADRASNLYIESRIPFGLRTGSSENIPDFINGPAPYNESNFINYLTEKLTVFDREKNGGRLYRGLPTAEVYSINPDYSRFNKEKSYIHLPTEYDCCGIDGNKEKFPTRVWYSQQSFQEEKTDNYKFFLPNNYRDIEGENGEITDLHKIGNSLFIHTREAMFQLPQNIQERVNGELMSFIGTGEFFNVPPRKVIDDNLGSAGTQHKWSKLKTKFGTIFVNEIENKVYIQSEGIKDLTVEDNKSWFEENLKPNLSEQIYNLTGTEYLYQNNPANLLGLGYLSCYDTRFERVLITKKDYRVITEFKIEEQIYGESPVPGSIKGRESLGYSTKTSKFWVGALYTYNNTTEFIYTDVVEDFTQYSNYFENKSWTISYSFNTNTWVSFHSYLPNYYIHNQNDFYSYLAGNSNIYKHNILGLYQTYYGKYYPHIIEYISNSNPVITKIYDGMMFITEAQKYDVQTKEYFDVEEVTFNKLHVYNSKQSSGELSLIPKGIQNDGGNYLFNQTKNNPGQILIDRNERTWSINQLRDFTIDYNKSIFTKNWSVLQNNYYIDKLPNNVTDFNKPWNQLQSFRDKYLAIRLKFDIFADINLTTHFILESEEKSER